MFITASLIDFMFQRLTALESMVNRQFYLLMDCGRENDRLRAENRRLEAELIQARLNCQEIRV